MSDSDIEAIYNEHFMPTLEPLYKLVKKEFPQIKKQTVKDFLSKQLEQQLTKEQKPFDGKGHITAIAPNEIWQLDIYVMQKYGYNSSQKLKPHVKSEYYNKDRNEGYNYIFAVVDVFTRYAYAVKMKTKTIEDTTAALDNIINNSKVVPHVITSDNDASFLGGKFQALLDKHNIMHIQNVKGDHNTLGIIDNFAKRLKTIFTKIFIKNKSTNWIDYLDKIIYNYNHQPHSALEGLTPDDVDKNDDNLSLVLEINQQKNKSNRTISDLIKGDLVRLRVKGDFRKGTEPKYSSKIYTVITVHGKRVLLDNKKEVIRNDLLKIPNDTPQEIDYNVIDEVNDENRKDRKNKKEGIDESNILDVGRIRKVMSYA